MLEVRSGNPALALYTKVGFTEVGRRENYYHGLENNRFDALTLQLDISSFANL
jgi:ribosomal-protein-alanine N-acetyltransferase